MSLLQVRLMQGGQIHGHIAIVAETVIETTLIIAPDKVSLPTLVSTENIIAKINEAGFELAHEKVVQSISHLVNSQYLPIEYTQWMNHTLEVEVLPITGEQVAVYQEVRRIRSTVLETAKKTEQYKQQGMNLEVRQSENQAIERITENIKSNPNASTPDWGRKILKFLVATALPIIFESMLGFSVHVLMASIFGGVFHVSKDFLIG